MSPDRRHARTRKLPIFTAVSALVLFGAFSCGPPSPIVIGGLVPETGSASVYGKRIKNGMTLALEEINAAGGVLGGRELRVEFRDTSTDPEVAEVAARELLDLGVPAVIGAGASPVSLHLAPLFNKKQVVLLSPSSSSPSLTRDGGDWFFRVYPSDVGESYSMAKFCRDNVVSRAAVIAVDDSYGQGAADEFVSRYEAATRQVVFRRDFPSPLTPAAATQAVADMKKQDPEAVFVVAYVDDMATLLGAMEQARVRTVRLGTSAVTMEMIEKAGNAAEGLIFPMVHFDPNDSSDPAVKTFVDTYVAKFNESPNNFSVKGYEALKVIAQAIEIGQVPTSKNIRDALLTSEFDGLTGKLQFDLRGDVTQAPRLYAVHNGQIVEYEKYRKAILNKSILAR